MKKLFTLVVAFVATTTLLASNTITYTATEKLTESTLNVGATTFGPAITSHTFSNRIGIISCSDEITTIGDGAFFYCYELTSVTIPNSVTTIGNYAFKGCTRLTSITIPNPVTTIGSDAFSNCSGLTSVTIPNSVTTIGSSAFYNCSGLKKTNYTGTIDDWCKIEFGVDIRYGYISNPMTYSHNFYINDIEVKDLVISEGVDKISAGAFYKCSGLTSVTIPNSVTTIGSDAFSNCSGLTSVTLNSNAICSKTYTSSSNIGTIFGSQVKEYIIGNSVTTIGFGAFCGCSGLKSVTIGNSVTEIMNLAFYGCESLKTVYNFSDLDITKGSEGDGYVAYYADNVYNGIPKGDFIIKNDTIVTGYIGNTTDIVIPDGITKIGAKAFYNYNSLTSVTIPNSVTEIGWSAFSDCTGLTSVTIPNSVTAIGRSAFSGCTSLPVIDNIRYADTYLVEAVDKTLSTYTIRDGTKWIGNSAFSGCNGLTSVTIPNSVTTVGEWAFSGCNGLTSVTIGNSVTTIGNYAFYNCSNLTSVSIPNSVTTIGSSAFYNVNNIVYSGMATGAPWGAKCMNGYIEGYLVYSDATKTKLCGCSTVATGEITIPNSVTTIGNYAFSDCNGLTSITIGNSVTTIGNYAFKGCTSLPVIDNIRYADTYLVEAVDKTLSTYTIRDGTKWIGSSAFSGCNGLTSVTIPNSVTTIGSSAFYNCSGLTSVTIGNSVTTIGDYAFYECSGLKKTNYTGTIAGWCKIKFGNSYANPMWYSHNLFINDVEIKDLVIPEGVDVIASNAFDGCSGLTSITCYATTPPTCDSYCFVGVDKTIPVYVHARFVDAYKQADGWKDFKNIQGLPNDYAIVTCSATNGTIKGGGQYIKGDTCTLTVIPKYGYHFTQWTDSVTDNPRSFIVTQDTIFTAQIDTAFSGRCGVDLTWKYSDGVLVISGTSAMYDYTQGTAPWMLFFQEFISSIVINNGCISIGGYAFYNCSNLTSVSIPNSVTTIGNASFSGCSDLTSVTIGNSVTTIGDYAFDGCKYLFDIYCYAPMPPAAQSSSFANYNVFLHVPCDNLRVYQTDIVFGSFKYIECISAEEKPITGDEVTIDPSADNVTITWPANDNASEYKLVITKDGIVFCTLTFNAQGQLIGIAFASSRDGELRTMSNAEMTATGWSFTVTGLNPGSTYSYTVDVVDAQKQSIRQYTGSFTTTGGVVTSLPTLMSPSASGKILYNGHLYILRDGNLFTATGARVK